MASKVDQQRTRQAHTLLSLYVRLYSEKYNRKPSINRYSAKWGMLDVIDSVGYERAVKLLEYYFHTPHVGHDIEFFYKNFDKMDRNLFSITKDRERRAMILAETAKRVEEEKDKRRE
jgi:hypothetical protein